MLDIRWMRENRAALAEAMQKLNDPDAPWAIALELDERRRQILTRVETLRAERNAGSKRVGELFREKKTQEANELKEQMSAIGGEIEALDAELRDVDLAFPGAAARLEIAVDADFAAQQQRTAFVRRQPGLDQGQRQSGRRRYGWR